MLNRQKTILELLKVAGRPVLRTELTKWSFLLRHEYPSNGGSAFYDFVPYKLGPFSFSLYQEAGKLENEGYIVQFGETSWGLSNNDSIDSPDVSVQRDVSRIINRFSNWNTDKLLDYVYESYPEYTVNSQRKKLAERATAEPAVYTAGYEGQSVDAFLNLLVARGVRRLIDVRHNPIARRYGFHRSTLKRLTANLEIDYVHVPELGIKSNLRQNLDTMDDRTKLFDQYEATTLAMNAEAIDRVASLIRETPSVLVCMEADAICCHRSRVAERIAQRTSLPIENL
ncbi:MAG: DUF488 family protein [Planctomycetaceae bacterium]|nr:DUF488 family protein [Planctomycetaceae bacterium]